MNEAEQELGSSSVDIGENPNCLDMNNERENPPLLPDSYVMFESADGAKSTLKLKLQQILSCSVCLELRRSAMYQCKFGHLICAGCFGDILAESRLQNEIASCPNCLSMISKELCSRNVAVEKTISELPMTCPHCSVQIPPEMYKTHKKCLCEKRPAICCNNVIGCPWEGTYCDKLKHQDECKQLSANGYEILKSLIIMDQESKEEVNLYEKIFELLSVEKFSYYDLQFKKFTSVENEVTYETSKFSAFENLWVVHGYFKDKSSEFNYQLVLKSKLSTIYINYPAIMDQTPADLHKILLLIWGCFSWYGLGPLHVVPGQLNADAYMNILDNQASQLAFPFGERALQ